MIRPELWRALMQTAAWGAALVWCKKTTDALRNLPLMANLTELEWDVEPEGSPGLTVIVPARDEAANIEATLQTLTQQDYKGVRVVAVDDRSTDATGRIMDSYADLFPWLVTVIHIEELPPGWLGKTHAMAEALAASESEYVLFTDADILFSPSVLRRALVFAQMEKADHVVVAPSPQIKTWGEGVMLGFFQVFGAIALKPWKIADPKAKDAVGIGAFNLLRRDALARLGGLAPQRMVVIEDLTLGRRVKAAGMRQRVAFAPGLVLVHWAAGGMGIVRVMTKNIFSATNFRPVLMLLGCVGIGLIFLGPLVGLFYWGTMIPGLLVVACVWVNYRLYGELNEIPAKYVWGYPLGAAGFLFAILRSIVVVLKDGGVKWRGTLYPLKELRRHNSPWRWKKKA